MVDFEQMKGQILMTEIWSDFETDDLIETTFDNRGMDRLRNRWMGMNDFISIGTAVSDAASSGLTGPDVAGPDLTASHAIGMNGFISIDTIISDAADPDMTALM